MTENKKSNRFNLKNYIAISAFNAVSTHRVKININKKVFFEEELTKNKEHHLKISDYIDYEEPGSNTIEITWHGEQDCEKKFMKIYKVIVNDQHIAPHSVMITPIQNEYIKNLRSTEEGSILYKKQLFNPGHRHGWYGTYKFRFLLDEHRTKNAQQESLIASTGIRLNRVYTDLEKIKYFDKANKR
jgi:hypothetical protein